MARITERDRRLLAFAAQHRLVLAAHVAALLDISSAAASTRLRTLVRADLLTRRTLFDRQPPCYQITRQGLAATGSSLSAPHLDLRAYEHDVALAWVWLAARGGALGKLDAVISERQLRSADSRRESGEQAFGVRLGGVGPRGRERLHYPDLLLQTASGHRVAVELELSSKGRARRERILSAYAADRRIGAVLYLVEQRGIGEAIAGSARRLGISGLVHVQQITRHERAGSAASSGAAQRIAACAQEPVTR